MYLPKGTLKAAVTYPQMADSFSDDTVSLLFTEVGLSHLVGKLHESDEWANRLSGGEQQRISLLRAILVAPDILLMDEMTSGLDEASGRRMIALLRQKLPQTALVLVSHQSFMRSLADEVIEFNPNGENHG